MADYVCVGGVCSQVVWCLYVSLGLPRDRKEDSEEARLRCVVSELSEVQYVL
jgi:hypothetical protein